MVPQPWSVPALFGFIVRAKSDSVNVVTALVIARPMFAVAR